MYRDSIVNDRDRRTPWSLSETMPLCASPGAIETSRVLLPWRSNRKSPARVGRSPNASPVTNQPSKSSPIKVLRIDSLASGWRALRLLVGRVSGDASEP